MFYLIYASTAAELMDEDSLLDMLEAFRLRNERLGVTGMLLHKGGNFMQMLEGDKEQVLRLFQEISGDPRHRQVTEVLSGEASERQFPNWTMGFFNMDKVPDSPDFGAYFEKAMNAATYPADSKNAFQFITRFNSWTFQG